ncbi:hypothetical protein BDW67DRAFT_166025 [Aspergillus spinulosporus]
MSHQCLFSPVATPCFLSLSHSLCLLFLLTFLPVPTGTITIDNASTLALIPEIVFASFLRWWR